MIEYLKLRSDLYMKKAGRKKKKAPVFKSPKILGWTSAVYGEMFDLAGGDAQDLPGISVCHTPSERIAGPQ